MGVFTDPSNVNFQYQENPTTTPSACFKNFFPGAEEVSLSSGANASAQSFPKNNNTDESTTQGCSLAQLAFKYKNTSGQQKLSQFDFKLEMIFKNEKVGGAFWALWNGTDDSGNNGKMTFHYYVVVLEKEASKDTGTIKGGYHGADKHGSDNNSRNVQIKFMNDEGLKNIEGQSPSASDEQGHTKQFIGRWNDNSSGGQKIFGGMDIQSPALESEQLKDRCEVFCKNYKDFKERSQPGENTASDFSPGFKKSYYFAKDSDTGKVDSSNEKNDFDNRIDTGLEPFRNKTGSGTQLKDNYCDSTSSLKSAQPEELEQMKTFCYYKSE